MKRKTLYMIAVIGLLATTACGNPKLKNGDEVVAKIDGEEYTANDLYEEMKGQYGYSIIMNKIDTAIAQKEVEDSEEIDKYVDEAIEFYNGYASAYGMSLSDFAANYLGLSSVKSEEDLRNYIKLDRKLTLAIQNQIASKIEDNEVEEYYNENYKTVYTYRDILIAKDDNAKDTIKKIKEALKEKKDEKLVEEFTSLAKKYSTAKNASDGGLYESATKNTVNSDVWKKLKDLDDYKYSDEIETDEGYHIILRISKDKSKELKDVKDEIKGLIAQDKLAKDQYLSYEALTELRNKYKIAFFDKDLKKNYEDFLDQVKEAKKQASNSNSNKESNKQASNSNSNKESNK